MTLFLARLLRRLGILRTTILITIASVVVSEVVTLAVMLPGVGWPDATALLVAAVVPTVCVPPFTFVQLRLILELEATRDELRRLSITDELSQAFNRRHFIELAEAELARALRYDSTFSLVIVDLDGFKALNDRHGHLAGDEVLRAVSAVCRAEVRTMDVFARIGGEEFVLLLPNTDATGAAEIAERLRERIAALEVALPTRAGSLRVTATFGIARHDVQMTRLGQLLSVADHALYAAKRAGKNRVAIATPFADGPEAIIVQPTPGRTAGGTRITSTTRPSAAHRADGYSTPAA